MTLSKNHLKTLSVISLALALAQPSAAQGLGDPYLDGQDNSATLVMAQTAPHNPVTPDLISYASQQLSLSLQKAKEPKADTLTAGDTRDDRLQALVDKSFSPAADQETGASAPAKCPDTYVASARASYQAIAAFMPAKSANDLTAMQAQLPALETAFDALPIAPIAPVVCSDHVNVFTQGDYARLKISRSLGVPSGVPASLRMTKIPDLPFAALAYLVTWTKYELKDFEGARLAASKGLVIDPYNEHLAVEYVADLIELRRFQDAAVFILDRMDQNYTLTDKERSVLLSQAGICFMALGNAELAEKMELSAIAFDAGNQNARNLLAQIRKIRGQSPGPATSH